MTGDPKYPFNTYVDVYYDSCRIRDFISGRGELLCQCTSQLHCSKQVLTHSLESRTLKKRRGMAGENFYPQSPLNTTLNFNKGDS